MFCIDFVLNVAIRDLGDLAHFLCIPNADIMCRRRFCTKPYTYIHCSRAHYSRFDYELKLHLLFNNSFYLVIHCDFCPVYPIANNAFRGHHSASGE